MSRESLLNAAVKLALSGAITSIDAGRITAEAESTTDEYDREFGSESALLEALHGHHISMLVTEIGAVVANLPAGRDRLAKAIDTFWEGCLSRVPVRRLIKNASNVTSVEMAVHRKNRAFEFLLQPELKAIGDPAPMDAARLLRAMVEEVALAEFEAGRPQPQLRKALWRMFDCSLHRPQAAAATAN